MTTKNSALFLGEKLREAIESNRLNTIRNYNVGIKVYPPPKEIVIRTFIDRYDSTKTKKILVKLDVTEIFFEYLDTHTNQSEIQQLEQAFLSDDSNISPIERTIKFVEYDIFGDVLHNKANFPTFLAKKVIDEFNKRTSNSKNNKDDYSLWLYGVGTLFPVLRPSSLLRYVHSILQWDYKDRLSILLFYPGHYDNGLHFMSQLSSDNDYRPKIYEG